MLVPTVVSLLELKINEPAGRERGCFIFSIAVGT